MKSSLNFLKTNNRIDIIYSGIFTKIVGLMSVFFLTYVLIPEDYGNLTYILSLINIIAPFLGLGLNHSLLRYGDSSSEESIRKLTSFTLYRGILVTFFEMLLLIIFVVIFNKNTALIDIVLVLSLQLIFTYPLRILQSKLRLERKNKDYAKTVFINSIALFLFLVIGFYTFNFKGVLYAYMLYPVVTLIFFLKRNLELFNIEKLDGLNNKVELYKYGVFVGLASVASQMLYSMDIVMLNNILSNPEAVAIYKVSSLVSVNGLIFCNNIMNADFVYIKEMNVLKVKSYAKKLMTKLFLFSLVLTLISLPVVYIATHSILNEVYKSSFIIHIILMVGFMFSFSIRIPIGTILSARGYANYNVYNAYFSLLINLILNFILIKNFGYLGAAIATVITMMISAIQSLMLYKLMEKKDVNN